VPDPLVKVVQVTPETAREWLERNKKNRPLRTSNITKYARDMESGRWQFTGEAIKFDEDGNLIDGQNRLSAVIVSGVTLDMLTVWGLPPESQEVMDSGVPRSTRDALHFHGYTTNTNVLAAAVVAHSLWTRGVLKHAMSGVHGIHRLTNSETTAYADQHPGLVEEVGTAIRVYRTLALPKGALAAAWYEFRKIDQGTADDLENWITDLYTAGKGDPVATLIKRTSEMKIRRQTIEPATALYMLFRTWNAIRHEEAVYKFQFGREDNWALIPRPE